jgi:hypothetical protein
VTRIRIWLIVLCLGLVNLSACGGDGDSSDNPPAPSRLEGPIIEVDSEGLGEVRAFTLKSGDQTYEILIAEDVDYGFPLDHLNEHRISGEPVVVQLEERAGKLVALSIEDA